ncbi:GNAT family N-acetyltransferase [Stutzerimonas degradans]|uniref:GNAT family N-acetyltransferase n=1 Tax=Stutzerimonas degradans TaxID=2968968 RepID=UPI0014243BB1|nr:GNAT family protein [Stutzerimonas degradans]NHW03473.1 GNAT family N-acetyltransferase [Stutzerimonas degradans]
MRVWSGVAGLVFFLRNFCALRGINKIKSESIDGLILRGYLDADAGPVSGIYARLNNGAAFSRIQRKLYSFIGSRCLFVVEKQNDFGELEIVGVNIYYINNRDSRQNTIHEGFIGVVPEFGGRGIATKMRKAAIRHFASAGFSGISTRISLNNIASLSPARKVGFIPIEKYQDPVTGEQRYYMICKF